MDPLKKMKPLTIHVPPRWIQRLDGLIEAKLYPNRADAVRTALAHFLSQEETLLELEEYARNVRYS